MKVIKGLLLGALFANIITILDAAGIISLGFRIREDGRTAGAIGESNQYAAFIILFLPATIAAAVASQWPAAAVLVRRHAGRLHDAGDDRVARRLRRPRHDVRGGRLSIPPSHFLQPHRRLGVRLADPAGAGGVVLAIRQPAGRAHDRDVRVHRREHRVFGPQRHLGAPRSAAMFAHPSPSSPASAGMSYASMPFQFSPHNHYLALWFNLGLVGLLCGTYLLFSAIGRARRASLQRRAAAARPAHRLRARHRRCRHRRVLRRPAQPVVLLLDVRRRGRCAWCCAWTQAARSP